MISVISYGSGNVQAIANIYHKLNVPFSIATSPKDLNAASKIILPGVGAFDEAMKLFRKSGMLEIATEMVCEKRVPVLGVCVGMQMMASKSEEGELAGLNWVDAEVLKMDTSKLKSKPRLPHMGWNSIRAEKDHKILEGIDSDRGFYFLHSFCIHCHNEADVLTSSYYGGRFISSFVSRNVYGFQFHPEKSHSNGIRVFKNFAEI